MVYTLALEACPERVESSSLSRGTNMLDREAKILAAQLDPNISEVDLHGLYPSEALEKTDLFIFDLLKQNKPFGRIIYGFGTGKLREEILAYLSKNKLIQEVVEDGGSCLIFL